jgi:hypothetical protein
MACRLEHFHIAGIASHARGLTANVGVSSHPSTNRENRKVTQMSSAFGLEQCCSALVLGHCLPV